MKSVYVAGGKANNTACNIMKRHLEGLGHRVTRDAKDPEGWDVTLRWGISYHGNKPALNAGVNQFDKYNAFDVFKKAGVLCPTTISLGQATDWCTGEDEADHLPDLPWLARKKHHVKGKDIRVCSITSDVEEVLDYDNGNCSHDFFSVFISTQTEYRVWVCTDKALAVYEKQFKGEGEYDGFCRNRRFGFKFVKRDDLRVSKEICEPSIKAVKALNMDWGAVDILQGKDNKLYILEVNSMPHIDTIERSSGIRLAAAVSKWAEAQP